MILEALELEVEESVKELRHLRDEKGHAMVVRNGKSHHERTVNLGARTISLGAPRVDDRRPDRRFTRSILPPYMRRSPRLEEALPVLYLRGLSTGDFSEALKALLGPEAAGFSATTITRLLKTWQDDYKEWRKRPLAGKQHVYVWAYAVYFNVRLEEDRLACLVIVGVLPDGRKEVVALEDGYRESTESWGSVLRDLKRRGLTAPMLGVGDGNLGFWAALREVYPETKEQRCWKHKLANVLDKLPKRLQARAKEMLHEIMYAPDRESALEEIAIFSEEYGARYPKAIETLTMALEHRDVEPGLLHHSDQGSQYTDAEYQQMLQDRGIEVSLNGVGSWYDNAPVESSLLRHLEDRMGSPPCLPHSRREPTFSTTSRLSTIAAACTRLSVT